jgi:hypothetical protein
LAIAPLAPERASHHDFDMIEPFRHRGAWIAVLLASVVPGCTGCGYRRCNAPPPAQLAALPERLSETGLFMPSSTEALAAGVRFYAPSYPLWSDGASKRRWVWLPEGSEIDSANMDDWVFPVGTKFWKEFSLDGKRVETRLLVKLGPAEDDWAGAAYLWELDQRDARLAPEGAKNSNDTGYEVPSATQCGGCHGGRRSHVLGFSAVQLEAADLPLSLAELVNEHRLSTAPAHLPAIARDERQRAALGYLHANCGHCHNPYRPPRGTGPRCYDPERSLDFWLPSDPQDDLAGALRTAVPRYVTPGDPDDSRLLTLVSRRGARLHMPPLGSHEVDAAGVALLTEWIASLPTGRTAATGSAATGRIHPDARSLP